MDEGAEGLRPVFGDEGAEVVAELETLLRSIGSNRPVQ
jgi:hypothetical protein